MVLLFRASEETSSPVLPPRVRNRSRSLSRSGLSMGKRIVRVSVIRFVCRVFGAGLFGAHALGLCWV